jgi:hypothetical protein
VVGAADSWDEVPDTLRGRLASHLDLLAFTTHSRFRIVEIIRAMDWEPRMKTRQWRVFHLFDPRYPPDPQLDGAFRDTVDKIVASQPPGFVVEALRLFRAGLLDDQQPDQFQRFWLALEVIAEGTKEKEQKAIPCPKCAADLYCPGCKEAPQRRPMARQAIRSLLERLIGRKADEDYRKLVRVRDGLMHGRSPATVAEEVEEKFANVVNRLAAFAWHAIMSSMPNELLSQPIHMGHRDGEFAKKVARVGSRGSFDCDVSTDYPAEDKIPTAKISMQVRFREGP